MGGADAIHVDASSGSTQATVTVNDTSVTGLTPATLSYFAASSVAVTGSTAVNTFSVTPSSVTSFTIDGGPFSPQPAPTAVLNVNTATAVAPVLNLQSTAAGDQGSFTFVNFQPVTFSRIGAVTPALATISGVIYSAQTASPLPNAPVFLDENNNGKQDAGEPTTVTDASGKYQFTSLAAGSYVVALAPGAFVATTAAASVTVSAGQVVAGVNIAAVPVPTPGAADLTGSFVAALPPAVIGGAAGKLKLKITNRGPGTASGPVQISLFASTDAKLDMSDSRFATLTTENLKLKKGAATTLALPFTYPSNLPNGPYFLLASFNSSDSISESNYANDVAASPKSVAIAAPFVDLTGKFGNLPKSLKAGKPVAVALTIQSLGNIPASGTIEVDLFSSADQTLDGSDTAIATHLPVKINIKPGKSQNVTLKVPAGATVAGSKFLIADINSTQSLAESSFANNDVVSSAVVPIA